MQASPDDARRAAHTVNALRAASAERHWRARWGGGGAQPSAGAQPSGGVMPSAGLLPSAGVQPPAGARVVGRPAALRVELRCFERRFSPRNFVLVGLPAWDGAAAQHPDGDGSVCDGSVCDGGPSVH
eukprot:531776-Prymnesium_polylepis.1